MNIQPIKKRFSTLLLRFLTISAPLLWGGVGGGLLSCGDFWEMDTADVENFRQMGLTRRVVTIMEGESYAIPVWFTPAELFNSTIYWEAEDDDVATFVDDTLRALSPGKTRVIATSTIDRLADTCWVYVMEEPMVDFGNYPCEMMLYASVTIHGEPLTIQNQDSVVIAAYVGSELRGVGTMRQAHGIEYMMMRIGAYRSWGDQVRLRCYFRGKALAEWFPKTFTFDGETLGTLSALYPLELPEGAEVYLPDSLGGYHFPDIEVPDTVEWKVNE